MLAILEKPPMIFKPRSISCLCGLALLVTGISSFAQNGIFADFTTSMGNFTCQLDYTNAPKAVANFIGLVTGGQTWLDLPSGRAKTNSFYNGLKFHRVVPGFVIQGGSPNGLGTDGPGYAFPDEFTTAVRFDRFGRLAMANSGKNSNGSQFFVTMAAEPGLNDVHTIFGLLTSGSNIVYNINHVPVTGPNNDIPVTPVTIQNIAIRRVGTAASNFDANAQSLPIVRNVALDIANSSTNVLLGFTNRQYCDNRLYFSTNLTTGWTNALLGIEVTNAVTNRIVRAKPASPKAYYSMAQIQYPSTIFPPKDVYRRLVAMTFSTGEVMQLGFNGFGGGSYNLTGNPNGTISSYTYTQDPYRGLIWPIYFSAYYPMTIELDFTNNTGGTFSATIYATQNYPETGRFSLQ